MKGKCRKVALTGGRFPATYPIRVPVSAGFPGGSPALSAPYRTCRRHRDSSSYLGTAARSERKRHRVGVVSRGGSRSCPMFGTTQSYPFAGWTRSLPGRSRLRTGQISSGASRTYYFQAERQVSDRKLHQDIVEGVRWLTQQRIHCVATMSLSRRYTDEHAWIGRTRAL
jgi:hypothetical protein